MPNGSCARVVRFSYRYARHQVRLLVLPLVFGQQLAHAITPLKAAEDNGRSGARCTRAAALILEAGLHLGLCFCPDRQLVGCRWYLVLRRTPGAAQTTEVLQALREGLREGPPCRPRHWHHKKGLHQGRAPGTCTTSCDASGPSREYSVSEISGSTRAHDDAHAPTSPTCTRGSIRNLGLSGKPRTHS